LFDKISLLFFYICTLLLVVPFLELLLFIPMRKVSHFFYIRKIKSNFFMFHTKISAVHSHNPTFITTFASKTAKDYFYLRTKTNKN